MKKPDFSPEQLCNEQRSQQNEMKKTSNIDLKFFMEENTENDEAFYATLDDQDSINSENMTSYPKSAFSNKGDEVCRSIIITIDSNFMSHRFRMMSQCSRLLQALLTTLIFQIQLRSNTSPLTISPLLISLSSTKVRESGIHS